jgi:hypothetical protein
MKKLLTFLVCLIWVLNVQAQAPSNDCGENYLEINQCGVDFSVSQATMGNATDDEFCVVGGSCPINYVNGSSYENFDCAPTGNSAGDDFGGSIENSLWWGFTPDETCSYDVTINITNCCCKDKGSTNAAQFQIFQTSAPLPTGSVQTTYAYETGVTGSFTETINVTQGKPVYILLDGLNGTDCDIDVSIVPGGNCSGCVLQLAENIWDFNVDYKKAKSIIKWGSEDIDNVSIEHSVDGRNWSTVGGIYWNTSETSFMFEHTNLNKGYNYYRLTLDGKPATRTKVIYHAEKTSELMKVYSYTGVLLWEKGMDMNNLNEYKGLIINLYEDGSSEKIIK